MNLNRYRKLLRNHFENGFSFYFILLLTLIFGIIIGSLILKGIDESTRISVLKFSNSYFNALFKGEVDSVKIFKYTLWFNLFYVLITYFIGIFNLGFIIPGITFIKGGLWGFLVGYLIENHGMKGFFISVVAIYPPLILYIPCIIALGALAMTMTFKYKLSTKRRVIKLKRLELHEYTIFVMVFSFIMLISIAYEAFISPIFLNLLDIIL